MSPFVRSFLILALLIAGNAPRHATAQSGGDVVEPPAAGVLKNYLINGFERAKRMDVAFALAVPDSALRWSPTPGVRDFAEQVVHTANNPFIVQSVFGESAPAFGDTAVALNDGQALARAVGEAYDWVLERLRALPPEKLAEPSNLFGRTLPKWRILIFALEHAMWTRGQLVPYFRLNGLEPPPVQLF